MTETILVTGGCGLIGSCFVLQQMAQRPDIHLINLDKLTYAGNPDSAKEVGDDPRYTFAQADVASVPVTVVIPCFNAADTVERALLSVAAQTRLPCQVVVVDDASDDEGATWSKLCDVRGRLAGRLNVELVHLDHNSGPSVARNTGWDRAVGDFVAVLDADDSWHPSKLAIQYGWMRAHPDYAMSGTGYHVVDDDDQTDEGVSSKSPAFWQVRPVWLLCRNPFITSTVMVRRGVQQRFSPAERRCEDYLLWLQLALSGSHMGYLLPSLTYLHKAPYGVSGLSADLSAMERSELHVLRRVHEERLVGVSLWVLATLFSRVKYLKRSVHVLARRRLSS
jgi:glycosyltransferase involved in cell wall biosynthesis